MTATDELRRLLDERGVEWETDRSGFRVMWGQPVDEFHDTMQFKAVDNALPNGGLNVHICGFTPAQAVEATLGRGDAYTREDVESAFVSGYSLGTLPVGSDPQWDENRQTVDEHMAELGWVRAETLGRGECRNASHRLDESRFHCSACGFGCWVRDVADGRDKLPRYCPNCGARVREDA